MSLPGNRRVYLVGFMGAGKTTAGKAAAARLGRAFLDTDEELVRREGRSIDEIFAARGEGYFRRVEWEVLQSLGSPTGLIATGGGAFVGYTQRRWMKENGLTVWLDAPIEVCRARVGPGADRPLWGAGDPIAQRALFEKRRACYALAHLRVDAGGSAAELVEGLTRALSAGAGGDPSRKT